VTVFHTSLAFHDLDGFEEYGWVFYGMSLGLDMKTNGDLLMVRVGRIPWTQNTP
jgi:hypothetical protein